MFDIFLISEIKLNDTFFSNFFKTNRYKVFRHGINSISGLVEFQGLTTSCAPSFLKIRNMY